MLFRSRASSLYSMPFGRGTCLWFALWVFMIESGGATDCCQVEWTDLELRSCDCPGLFNATSSTFLNIPSGVIIQARSIVLQAVETISIEGSLLSLTETFISSATISVSGTLHSNTLLRLQSNDSIHLSTNSSVNADEVEMRSEELV